MKPLFTTLSWWIHVIRLSKPTEYTTSGANHSVHYGLRVTVTCQCRLIIFNKRTAPVGGVDQREGYACVREGVTCKSSAPCPHFCCEAKAALKNHLLKTTTTTTRRLGFQCPTEIKTQKLTGRNTTSALPKEGTVRLAINVKNTAIL